MTSHDERRPLRALVDESLTPDKTAYIMTAAIVDPHSKAFRPLMDAFREVAARQKEGVVHANVLPPADRDALERLLVENRSVHFLTSVRAPVVGKHATTAKGAEDRARQRCVGDLAVDLWAHRKVNHMILESRNPDPKKDLDGYRRWINKRGNRDNLDVKVTASLMGLGELGRRFKVEHQPKSESQLWLADVAAYAAQQSIAQNDPDRLATLSSKMEFREAIRLPIEERPSIGIKEAPKSGLDLRMDELAALARQVSARNDRQVAYAESDDSGVRSAADRLAAAQAELTKVLNDLERRGQDRHLPVPPLPEILNPARGYDRDK